MTNHDGVPLENELIADDLIISNSLRSFSLSGRFLSHLPDGEALFDEFAGGFRPPNVAIDGPAGAGKSTLARLFAHQAGLRHVDSGAMYRAVTLIATERGWTGTSGQEDYLAGIAREIDIEFSPHSERGNRVFLAGQDRTEALRGAGVERLVSVVARMPEVRRILVDKQKQMARAGGVVMDGRDIGTCVLPSAEMKIYLTAATGTRISRRLLQRRCEGTPVSWTQAAESVMRRDRIDSTREASPLRPARDAVVIDTTDMWRDEVVRLMLFILEARAGTAGRD